MRIRDWSSDVCSSDLRLHRRQPERETARIMFDEDADEPLVGTEDRPMQHHRPVPLAILADIGRVESLRQHPVRLDRAYLPGPPDRIGQMPFQLRRIRSEEHTSELQSLMRLPYALF